MKLTCEERQTDVVASLVFENCVIEDGGEIQVKATNPAGEVTCIVTLTVQSMYATLTTRCRLDILAPTHVVIFMMIFRLESSVSC